MVKSVKKALDILTILSGRAEEPITLGELAEMTGLNKSTCSHIVDTLCDSLYVERVSRTKGYRLGPWAYMLSRYGRYQNTLVSISAPVIKWLQAKIDATVFISVICNGKKYIVYHIDKRNILPMSDGSIIQGYLETTATGLLLMAHMNTEALRYALTRMEEEGTPMTQSYTAELMEKFKQIKTKGYCYLPVVSQNTHSYAFPITDGKKVIAALGVLYPEEVHNAEYRTALMKFSRTAASEISRRLEFTE